MYQTTLVYRCLHAFNSTQKKTAQLERDVGFKIVTRWAYKENRFFSYPKSKAVKDYFRALNIESRS
jgi:hypothetical protein